ncbi:MAG: hypothetical protein IPK90_11570 [Chitinophagaceae bacterium]|nr:hypothetical protein [Chitinophagaceae bacterium]
MNFIKSVVETGFISIGVMVGTGPYYTNGESTIFHPGDRNVLKTSVERIFTLPFIWS